MEMHMCEHDVISGQPMTAAGNEDPEADHLKMSAAGSEFPGMAHFWIQGEYTVVLL